MILNHDCMRDVLLFIESVPSVSVDPFGSVSLDEIDINAVYSALNQRSKEDVYYAVFNLEQAGYINSSVLHSNNVIGDCYINYMTLRGHEFLDSVRDEARWRKIKTAMNAIKDYSLSALSAIAEGVTSGAITAYLQKHS